jgi:GNAT superfamily N-acetyltransferase
MLAGNVARDIRVSLNDYDEGTRVFSAAAWRPFAGTLDMLLGLKHAFLDRVRFYYPALASETNDDLLLDAALEVYGVRDGVALLRAALVDAERAEEPGEETVALRSRIEAYIGRVTESGYMPRSLHFAIARYHAWAQQVPDASLYARAAQLRELQNNYRIDAVTRRFPEARLWSYAETVLRDSPAEGRRTLVRAMRDLRDGTDIQHVLGRLYAELKERLPSHDQQFFLTRVAYPHLELDEKAELVTSTEVGRDRAELVTAHIDRIGREIRFRPAASSAEVDALYRIFYVSDIGGGLSAHERLLVALDPAGCVLGGIGHIRRTPYHVLLHKIAVLPRCRSRGIGRLLLHEFLRRRAAESVAVVSAEFILVDWLAQFGFRPDPRYPGVVLSLTDDDWPARFAVQA